MKSDDKQLELGSNAYFRIVCVLSEKVDLGKWLARIRVIRKDTGEYINAGFTEFDVEKNTVINAAKQKIKDFLLPELDEMGVPPDWGSEIRNILSCCTKLRSTIFEFGSFTIDTLSLADNEDKFSAEYAKFWNKLIKETVALSSKIEALNAKDRIKLLMLPEDVIKGSSNIWNLMEIDARIMVYEFYLNPTDEEQKVHDEQKKRLADKYDELGWK
jgi:hypothetical protein